MVAGFVAGHVEAGSDGQISRAAQRLGLIAAAGELANPRFYTQIGKDPGALIEAGHAALRERFGAQGT
jgi:hypothetical protein